MKKLFALMMLTVTASANADTIATEKGPEQLAVSFMTQFYDVKAEVVQVTVIEQTRLSSKVKAEAKGHVCIFDAQPLPTAQYGWAASSMNCAQ
ncbi:hypothetical protein [Pseudomonas syringae]|uniref:hypothetical protein n=1 Tax=Pseudomonas syringae TaxID=317 RepID=UPI000466EFDE|nr:hypothetical protein [Pseudomonas syringae]QGG78926.1 hypothetical protein N028_26740 [Pseudomonas syringae USA011]